MSNILSDNANQETRTQVPLQEDFYNNQFGINKLKKEASKEGYLGIDVLGSAVITLNDNARKVINIYGNFPEDLQKMLAQTINPGFRNSQYKMGEAGEAGECEEVERGEYKERIYFPLKLDARGKKFNPDGEPVDKEGVSNPENVILNTGLDRMAQSLMGIRVMFEAQPLRMVEDFREEIAKISLPIGESEKVGRFCQEVSDITKHHIERVLERIQDHNIGLNVLKAGDQRRAREDQGRCIIC